MNASFRKPTSALAVTALCLVALAGCSAPSGPRELAETRAANAIEIRTSVERVTVAAKGGTAGGSIDGSGHADLLAALGRLGDPGTIHARLPAGTPPGMAEAVHAILTEAGVPAGNVAVATGPASTAPVALGQAAAPTAVTLVRYRAVAPACGAWTDLTEAPFENRPAQALGCANAANLATMIADPTDLVRGRSLDAPDATRELGAVERYRTNRVKPFVGPTATGVVIAPSSDR